MIFVAILLLIAGFVALVKGADVFVDGAAALAGNLVFRSLVIGLRLWRWVRRLPEAAVQHHCEDKGVMRGLQSAI